MRCQSCSTEIARGRESVFQGKSLCDDCFTVAIGGRPAPQASRRVAGHCAKCSRPIHADEVHEHNSRLYHRSCFFEGRYVETVLKEAVSGPDVSGVLLTTTSALEGFRVVRTIDVITAECVFGISLFRDLFAGLTDSSAAGAPRPRRCSAMRAPHASTSCASRRAGSARMRLWEWTSITASSAAGESPCSSSSRAGQRSVSSRREPTDSPASHR